MLAVLSEEIDKNAAPYPNDPRALNPAGSYSVP
jgi:hypothetical protein